MTDSQRLNAVDTIWLDAERPGPSIAIGAVLEMEGPAPTIVDVRAFVASRLDRIPRLQERLSPSSLRIKRPTWEPTTADLTHHVEHMALDGDSAALEGAVSVIMEKPMDFAGPLWDIHLLTGLPDDRFALVTRMHHAAADGQGSLFAFGNLIDVDPEGTRSLTDVFTAEMSKATSGADAGPSRSSRDLLLDAAARGSDLTLRALRASLSPGAAASAASEVGRATAQIGRTAEGVRAIATPRTRSLIGGDPGARRYWRTTQVSLADIRTIRTALGGTVNDVVMTLVSGGYGTMMSRRDQDPSGQYLRVMIPVSIRAPGDLAANNQTTALFIQLPVSGPAGERMEWIRTHINTIKQAGTANALKVLTDMLYVAPALIQTAAVSFNGVLPEWMVDTLVTNVPGPPFANFVMGRPLVRNMPIVALGTPLWCAVAVVSYDGQLNFGISTGEGGEHSGDDIGDGIHVTLDELLVAAADR